VHTYAVNRYLLYLTSRRQTGCCFQLVWSLFSTADLPKSRAALTLAYLSARTPVQEHQNKSEWVPDDLRLLSLSCCRKRAAENGCPPSSGGSRQSVVFIRPSPSLSSLSFLPSKPLLPLSSILFFSLLLFHGQQAPPIPSASLVCFAGHRLPPPSQ
jgi:hypothetical protein